MAEPPTVPPPSGVPASTPATPNEWREHLDLQITCWDFAHTDLLRATDDRSDHGEFARYRALTDALERAYAVDASLTVLYRLLAPGTREALSVRADNRVRGAIEHNKTVVTDYVPTSDANFTAYYQRGRDGQPYRHWSGLVLAGGYQRSFFAALDWVRGQLVHAATSAPMDLRQWRAGAEPRFKWRESASFARGRKDDAGRRVYDRVLAGRDVTGTLSHLTEVFLDGRRVLTQALRDETT